MMEHVANNQLSYIVAGINILKIQPGNSRRKESRIYGCGDSINPHHHSSTGPYQQTRGLVEPLSVLFSH